MAKEIEHKYLVKNELYKRVSFQEKHITQGYISREPERVVRIRIIDDKGTLTIKGKNDGDSRLEFEYSIPLQDAKELLSLCEGRVIEKIRHLVRIGNDIWEVDEFIHPEVPTIAEIEIPYSGYKYEIPDFIGKEVTGNPLYYNSNL